MCAENLDSAISVMPAAENRREVITPRRSIARWNRSSLNKESRNAKKLDRRGPLRVNDRDRGGLAAPPLPHHRAYGSVHGGSRSCANTCRTRMGDRAI